jgi:hypothetical protein
MSKQILRDVVAGCAGALVVLAIIGLPGRSASSTANIQARTLPVRCTYVLPVIRGDVPVAPLSRAVRNVNICPQFAVVAPAKPAAPAVAPPSAAPKPSP